MENDLVVNIGKEEKSATNIDHHEHHEPEEADVGKLATVKAKIDGLKVENQVESTPHVKEGIIKEDDVVVDSTAEVIKKDFEREGEEKAEVDDQTNPSSNKLDHEEKHVESSKLISSITHVLGGMLKDISNDKEDILKLGVGLGMSLSAQGVLSIDEEMLPASQDKEETKSVNSFDNAIHPHLTEEGEGEEQERYMFPNVTDKASPDKKDDHSYLSKNSQESSQNSNEVEHSFPKAYVTHEVSELGILPKELDFKQTNKLSLRGFSEAITTGFLESIKSRKVGKQHVHYIESTLNLPECKPVGRVKPRSAGKDWQAIGFDPWSTGKELLNIEFVPFLVEKEEENTNNLIPLAAPKDVVCFVNREETKETTFMRTQFKRLCSLIRHGNYVEFEELLEDCDGLVPIDHTDDVGNTLLMVSCQNGNKRMVKLCLRKGSDLNKQNTNGHTSLHYAFGYGFDDLGAYLISKGADDNITNADGLTCYEGLNIEDISAL